MNTVNELLVLKYSSELIACLGANGSYVVDHANIRRNGRAIAALLSARNNVGLVVVTSAAYKLLGNDAWHEVSELWGDAICRRVKKFQVADDDFYCQAQAIIAHVASGGVAIVNGNNKRLAKASRWQNNDYVAADIIGEAAVMQIFKAIELGVLTNVNGLLRDVNDTESVMSVVRDIQVARGYVADGASTGTTGGMSTKLDAVAIALGHGVGKAWVAHGRTNDVIELARAGKIGTTFLSA